MPAKSLLEATTVEPFAIRDLFSCLLVSAQCFFVGSPRSTSPLQKRHGSKSELDDKGELFHH